MRFRPIWLRLSAIALLCAISVSKSHAYALQYTGLGFGQSISVTIGSGGTSTFAGQINFGWSSGSGGTPNGFPSTFQGFCTELEQGLQNPQEVLLQSTNQLTRQGNSPNTGQFAAWLYNNFGAGIANNVQGAGLQAAIWEVLYDQDRNLSTGYFQVSGANADVVAQAQTYINALNTNFSSSQASWFYSATGQDILGPAPTPEPGTLSLFAAGSLSAFAAWRRKKRQQG